MIFIYHVSTIQHDTSTIRKYFFILIVQERPCDFYFIKALQLLIIMLFLRSFSYPSLRPDDDQALDDITEVIIHADQYQAVADNTQDQDTAEDSCHAADTSRMGCPADGCRRDRIQLVVQTGVCRSADPARPASRIPPRAAQAPHHTYVSTRFLSTLIPATRAAWSFLRSHISSFRKRVWPRIKAAIPKTIRKYHDDDRDRANLCRFPASGSRLTGSIPGAS